MDKQKVFLYISEVASYIGQNKWDYVTPFERIWKRCDKDGYNLILETTKKNINEKHLQIKILDKEVELLNNDLLNKRITKRQWESKTNKLTDKKTTMLTEISSLNSRVDEIDLNQKQKLELVLGRENIESIESKTIETDSKRENVNKIIENMQISDVKKKTLIKETESFINKTHGTLKEESAIEMYEKKFNVKLNTSQEFYKYRLNISNTSEFEWYVGGKVDGLYIDDNDKSKSYIVEVKNRTKGFFSTLRDYENTQIQLYMYILDISFSKLVEKYNNKIRITLIYRDDDYIKDILTYLDIFINNFEKTFLNNNEKQRDFVLCDNDLKKVFLKKLYLNDITNKINMKILETTNDTNNNCLIDDLD
jgi:hypothetical protein